MLPFIIALFPILFAAVFQMKHKENKFHFFTLLPLALLIALKGESIGADTENYNRFFIAMRNGTFDSEPSYERLELGYKFFLRMLTHISQNPQIQHIAYALLFLLFFGLFLKKNAASSARFGILFMGMNLFSFYFTGIRQALAMMICLLAYECIKKKHTIRFFLTAALATLFHKAALFFLLAYPIARMKVKKKRIPLYVILFALVMTLHQFLFEFASEFFDIKYGVEETGNGYISVIIMAIITIFSFLKTKQLLAQNPNNSYLINLNVVHMSLWVLRLFSRTAERPSMFYTCFTILLVEQLILTVKNSKERFWINAATMCFFAALFIYRINTIGLIPYRFFWQ